MTIQFIRPQERHVRDLIEASAEFAAENEWARNIPIGCINTPAAAADFLTGPNVAASWVAEDDRGKGIGFITIRSFEGDRGVQYEASLIIANGCRRSGLGRQLADRVFRDLQKGTVVEAWVAGFNRASLAATPRMGFSLREIIEDEGRSVHVFERRA